MARRNAQPKLDSATARKRLEPWHGVYWNVISKGCYFGYRRSTPTKAGSWYAKFVPPKDAGIDGSSRRIQEVLGTADDFLPADAVNCLSYEQAHKKAAEWFPVAVQKATGLVPQRRQYRVSDACTDYLQSLQGRSPSYYVTKTIIEANIIPLLGAVVVEKLTRARIENWLNQMAATARRKPRHGLDPESEEAQRRRKDSANRYLTMLRAALNRCLADGKVACSGLAWRQVQPFRGVSQTRTRFLSDSEARKLVAACPPDFCLLVQAALFSGARYSELARLRVGDFDPGSATLLIATSKSKKSRRIYLDPEAGSFFSDVCQGRRASEPILRLDGAEWARDKAQGMMAEATKAAEIDPLTFHELRHSAASRWARQGLSLAEIAAQLGHADLRMTQKYAHLCQNTLAQKVRAMPALGIYQPALEEVVVVQ